MHLQTFKNTRRGLWVGWGLVVIGVVLTFCLMYFNGKHGWSLGREWDEKIPQAILHAAVDPVTALLVSAGAIAMAWYYRWTGVAICIFALILTSYSMLTTAGFMSNRLVGVFSQKAQLAELKSQSREWQGALHRRDLTRHERMTNRAEVRANYKEAVKVAGEVHDPQAMWLAGMLGLAVETVQRILNLIASGIGQIMKYVTLLVGFFLLSNRDKMVAEANQNNSGGSTGGSGFKPQLVPSAKPGTPEPMRASEGGLNRLSHPEPNKVSGGLPRKTEQAGRKLSRDEVWDHLRRQADGREPMKSSNQNAKDFGHPQRTVYRWQKRLSHQAKSKMRKVAANGGGYHHAPAYN